MSMTLTSSQVIMKKEGGERLLEFVGCSRGCALASSHYFPTDAHNLSFYSLLETVLLCNSTFSVHLLNSYLRAFDKQTLFIIFSQQVPSQRRPFMVDWWDQRLPVSSASSSETSESVTGSGTRVAIPSYDSQRLSSTRFERSR